MADVQDPLLERDFTPCGTLLLLHLEEAIAKEIKLCPSFGSSFFLFTVIVSAHQNVLVPTSQISYVQHVSFLRPPALQRVTRVPKAIFPSSIPKIFVCSLAYLVLLSRRGSFLFYLIV